MKVSGRTHFIIINIVIAFLQNPHTSFFNHISFMTLNDIPRFILLQKQSNIKSRSSQINRKQVQKRRKSSQGNIRTNTIHKAAWRYCSFQSDNISPNNTTTTYSTLSHHSHEPLWGVPPPPRGGNDKKLVVKRGNPGWWGLLQWRGPKKRQSDDTCAQIRNTVEELAVEAQVR